MAFVILSSLVWVYLNIKSKLLKNFFPISYTLPPTKSFSSYYYYKLLLLVHGFSGLDAGRIYQTWPSYGNLLPSDINFQNLNYIDFKNNSYVQFLHRNLGYIIFFSLYVGYKIFFIFQKKKNWYIHLYFSSFFNIYSNSS